MYYFVLDIIFSLNTLTWHNKAEVFFLFCLPRGFMSSSFIWSLDTKAPNLQVIVFLCVRTNGVDLNTLLLTWHSLRKYVQAPQHFGPVQKIKLQAVTIFCIRNIYFYIQTACNSERFE